MRSVSGCLSRLNTSMSHMDEKEKEKEHAIATLYANKLLEDGINEEFFNLLWAKDELNFGPSINIPDTIFFKYGQPVAWYFTSTQGRIKKKNRANLLNARIEEAFNKYVLGYDVVGMFIHTPIDVDPETGVIPPSTIEYLDRKGLNDFLYKNDKEVHGALQRFIEPKGTKNEIVRAIWSPKVCLLERAENIHNLHDHRYGLYERCITYDGPEYYCTSAPLRGPVLAGQLQKICESVIAHISEVTYGQHQISRLVVNFKVDSRDKIWLLYTTSIRCSESALDFNASKSAKLERSLVNIDGVITLPTSVNLNPNRSYDKIALQQGRIRCISCANETLQNLRYPITYKSIVKHYEHLLHLVGEISGTEPGTTIFNWPPDRDVIEAAGGVGFGCLKIVGDDDALAKPAKLELNAENSMIHDLRIPPIIRYLHPKLTAKSYLRCKLDPLFLYKTVSVCESCYLVYAEFTTMLLRLGQDLTKLLTPDPGALSGMHDASTLTRPSSAEWRNLSSVARSHSSESLHGSSYKKEFLPSNNHISAKNNAIGLMNSSNKVIRQPDMPRAIRKKEDTETLRGGSIDSFGTAPQLRDTSLSLGNSMSMGMLPASGMLMGSGNGSIVNFDEDENTRMMIEQREKHFFQEISRNPNLKDQHPLMHLINAQEKLRMIDEQSGVIMSKAAAKKVGIFGEKFGKQSADESNVYAVYEAEQPYRIKDRATGEIKLMKPSAFNKMKRLESIARLEKKKRREERKRQRQELLFNQMQETVNPKPKPVEKPKEKTKEDVLNEMAEEGKAVGGATETEKEDMFDDDSMLSGTTGSKKHAQFLREALAKIESEVDLSMPYVEAVEAQIKEKELRKSTKKKGVKRASLADTTTTTTAAVSTKESSASSSPKKLSDRKTIATPPSVAGSKKVTDSELNTYNETEPGEPPSVAPAESKSDTPALLPASAEKSDAKATKSVSSETKDKKASRPSSMVGSRPGTTAQSKRGESREDTGRKGSPTKIEPRLSTPGVAAPVPPIVSGGSSKHANLFYQDDSDDEASSLLKSWGIASSPVTQIQNDHEDYILSSHENLHRSHEILRDVMSSESSRATSSRLLNRLRTVSRSNENPNTGSSDADAAAEFFNDNNSANNVKIAV